MNCPKCNNPKVDYYKETFEKITDMFYWVCWTSAEHHYYKVSYIKYCPFCGYKLKNRKTNV